METTATAAFLEPARPVAEVLAETVARQQQAEREPEPVVTVRQVPPSYVTVAHCTACPEWEYRHHIGSLVDGAADTHRAWHAEQVQE